MQQFVKVWYCPETKGYLLFDNQGRSIPGTLDAEVTVLDNWSMQMEPKDRSISPSAFVKITMCCEIVNEEPKPTGASTENDIDK